MRTYGILILLGTGCAASFKSLSGGEEPQQDSSEEPSSEPSGEPSEEPSAEPSEDSAIDPVEDEDQDGYSVEEGDCDDNDPNINPNAEDIPNNGIDEDCSGADATDDNQQSILEGDLLITEIMQNPASVSDSYGEWFEIYNTTSAAINLNGLVISDLTDDEYSIDIDVMIPSNGYLVLGNNADTASNGNIVIDLEYSDISLGNGDDEVILTHDGVGIDSVAYDDGSTFPDPTGASMTLDSDSYTTAANDNGSNWCEASSTLSSGDQGTPQTGNDDCDAISVTDTDGDGYDSSNSGGTDCDDSDDTIHPGAIDYSDDGIDQDCDGSDFTDGMCDDSCSYADDGACDDGGPNASYTVCTIGTDCTDCGVRWDVDGDGYYDDEGGTPYNANLEMDCDDSDASINPGEAEISEDGIDQDCSGSDLAPLCDESCAWSNDGACDDGGFDSDFSLCGLGTDCSDCGERWDVDDDGYDSILDCDDDDSTIYPGADCDICDGTDEDGDGLIDEDAGYVDQLEPFDSTSALVGDSLYVLGDQATETSFLFPSSDEDAFAFFFDDDTDIGFSDPDELTCSVTPPSTIDIILDVYWEEDGTSGYVYYGTYDDAGVGGAEGFVEGATATVEDGGHYMLIVNSVSGEDCANEVTFYCEKTGD